MLKDNHIVVSGGITKAVASARKLLPILTKIEVECDRVEQVAEALQAGADVIMLDNMALEDMRTAVGMVAGKAKIEASGGINFKTIRAIAETGVDYISTSKITQAAPPVDIGLDD
jgi:nicotinate-nucleotide pyrophosphorylase (carboxylating)